MNPEEIERELNKLWERVSSPPAGGGEIVSSFFSSGADVSLASQGAALEAIQILKRQHRQQLVEWEKMMDMKEKALQELSQRLHATEADAVHLRRFAQQMEARLLESTSEVTVKLESAGHTVKEQEERFNIEETRLREQMDRIRQQLTAETDKWRDLERKWNKREEEYIEDLRQMRGRLSNVQEGTAQSEEKSRHQVEELKEAKKAIEATLGELLSERRLREEALTDREKANQKVAEVTEHMKQLQGQWEEERKQWQELWDRERSNWESQRQEFSVWEERLRKEREEWHAKLREKEDEVLRFSSQMTQTLKDSSETSDKLSKLLKIFVGVSTGVWNPLNRKRMLNWAPVALVICLLASAYPIWRYAHRLRFELLTSHSLPLDNPTAIAFDGTVLWGTEWSGRLVSIDPGNPAHIIARYTILSGGAFRPVSVAVGNGALWSLDSAQGRILRHNITDPTVIQLSWASPGPGPAALAHDGQNLWSYDAVTKTLYRHMGDGPRADLVSFTFDLDVVPVSMLWSGDELWILDSKGKRILLFGVEGKSIRLKDTQIFEPSAISIAIYRTVEGKRAQHILWALCADGGGGFSLKKYRVYP